MEVVLLKKNELIRYSLILSVLCLTLAIVLFSQASFLFLGIGVSVIGFILLYLVNHK